MDGLTAFLAARAVPGVEQAGDGRYRRTLRLAHGPATLTIAPAWREAAAADARDRAAAEAALARIAGPGAEAAAAAEHLGRDPVLGPVVARTGALAVPGTPDPAELAIRAVLGQQVSLAAARTLAGRLVADAGTPAALGDGLTHLWPEPAAIAEAAPRLAMPRSRQRAVAALAGALAGGLDLRDRAAVLALPGVGPWTAGYIALRALRDPDAWLPADLGVRHALARLGAPRDAPDRWRPYRGYAVVHLWASLAGEHPY